MSDTTPRDPATEAPDSAAPYSPLVHWVKLISGAIVGLAALLGAIAVIIDLVDKDPEPVVGAEIEKLELTATTLDDFQARQRFSSAALPRSWESRSPPVAPIPGWTARVRARSTPAPRRHRDARPTAPRTRSRTRIPTKRPGSSSSSTTWAAAAAKTPPQAAAR